MQPSGHVFFRDEYETSYELDWSTVNDVIDYLMVVKQPYVWGMAAEGYIRNGILFRKGIVTTTRQVIRPLPDGYEIVAEGSTQIIDFIQMNFPCAINPSDNFSYHVNNGLIPEVICAVTDGPRWADPNEENDDDVIWAEVEADGDTVDTGSADVEYFAFIDVWSA